MNDYICIYMCMNTNVYKNVHKHTANKYMYMYTHTSIQVYTNGFMCHHHSPCGDEGLVECRQQSFQSW